MYRLTAVIITTVIAWHALAGSQVFQAQVKAYDEPGLTEQTSLNFGTLTALDSASCSLSENNTLSGQCDNANGDAGVAAISLSGLVANQPYQVTVTSISNDNIAFSPSIGQMIDDVMVVSAGDGEAMLVSVSEAEADAALRVYGDLSVLQPLEAGQTYHFSYTIEVNFQ
ncbi:hypothetical protein [Alteromonas sp. CYL-A6]|uniref:hypothetical protein n=1 Tax=Alteromonas nitratireducens TaxID=3390813 RepID=UPI0034BC15A8